MSLTFVVVHQIRHAVDGTQGTTGDLVEEPAEKCR